mgnify:CR=1 FL=1
MYKNIRLIVLKVRVLFFNNTTLFFFPLHLRLYKPKI